ncbi:MAG: hypothetical protein M1831_006462 [Alyxoria varia]|nr:MAG: hypothetical protein M1831_006462 [Alyxoria varia]
MAEEDSNLSYKRVANYAIANDHAAYRMWMDSYFEVLFRKALGYEQPDQAGQGIRHLWFAPKNSWPGPTEAARVLWEGGAQTELWMKELGVS